MIHRIPVATPYTVGAVNAYLIEDEPLTLVDTGPNWGTSLDEIDEGLRALGHRIADLELLLLSHQHVDHFGLAGILARRSGAEVAVLDLLVPWVTDYDEEAKAENVFAARVMAAHGVPPEIHTILPLITQGYRNLGAAVPVDRVLRDGDDIRLRDRTLRVLHRPGHSPSDTVFHDASSRTLLAADHLIGHISSNPLVHRPLPTTEHPDVYDGRPRSLVTYMASMRATQAMDAVELVLPGHGEPVTDHVELIDGRFRMHERRAEKMLALLREGPRSAHGVAREMWGQVAIQQAYLTLSEVLGHMDLLIAEGQAREEVRDGVVEFHATG